MPTDRPEQDPIDYDDYTELEIEHGMPERDTRRPEREVEGLADRLEDPFEGLSYRTREEAADALRTLTVERDRLEAENERLREKVGAARRWLELGEPASAARALEPETEG